MSLYRITKGYDGPSREAWELLSGLDPVKPRAKANEVASVAGLDLPHNVDAAIRWLKSQPIKRVGVGEHSDDFCLQLAYWLRDYGISATLAPKLIKEHWAQRCPDQWDWDFIVSKVENAYKTAENAPGRDAASDATVAFAHLTGKPTPPVVNLFPVGGGEHFDLNDEPEDIHDYLGGSDLDAPDMLVPNWIERGIYTGLVGATSAHKSRLLLMITLCILYRRDPFQPNLPAGSIWHHDPDITHIEYLSAENTKRETRRRIGAMVSRLNLTATLPTAAFKIWELRATRRRILIVDERAEHLVRLTRYGQRVVERWKRMAEAGARTLVVLDSLFNLIQFKGTSKNSDDCAMAVVEALDYWCSSFNLTILAPFHPSRAGSTRGDTGYSPMFENTPRMVLGIKENFVGKGDNRKSADTFDFGIIKWNNGPKGKPLTLEFDNGILRPWAPVVSAPATDEI